MWCFFGKFSLKCEEAGFVKIRFFVGAQDGFTL